MRDQFWRELTKESALEEMYDLFAKDEQAGAKRIAIRLARFAEAHIFNAADRRIAELEDALKKARDAASQS